MTDLLGTPRQRRWGMSATVKPHSRINPIITAGQRGVGAGEHSVPGAKDRVPGLRVSPAVSDVNASFFRLPFF